MVALQGYQYIFEMDADFSHNPADLGTLIPGLSFWEPVWLLAPGMLREVTYKLAFKPHCLIKGASLYTQLIT